MVKALYLLHMQQGPTGLEEPVATISGRPDGSDSEPEEAQVDWNWCSKNSLIPPPPPSRAGWEPELPQTSTLSAPHHSTYI